MSSATVKVLELVTLTVVVLKLKSAGDVTDMDPDTNACEDEGRMHSEPLELHLLIAHSNSCRLDNAITCTRAAGNLKREG